MSSHDAALWSAYRRTRYVAHVRGAGEVMLRIGEPAPGLDAVLAELGLAEWCFVTAWNPYSQPLAPGANADRNAALRTELDSAGLAYHAGEGRGDDPGWAPEASFLVLGLGRDAARDLGRRHGQNAVVVGRRGGVAELLDCRPDEAVRA